MKNIWIKGILFLISLGRWKEPFSFEVGPSRPRTKVYKHVIWAIFEMVFFRSHRGEWFQELYARFVSKLKELMEIPEDRHVWLLSSGTEAMERVVQNLVKRKSLHLVYDAFSKRWYDAAVKMGRNASLYKVADGDIPDLDILQIDPDIELVCITLNGTSTGAMIPSDAIARLRERYPNVLIAVDMVSCAPITDVDMSLIDVAFFSVQKCFSLPAGLCVLVVSERARMYSDEIAKTCYTGTYHSFQELYAFSQKNQTPDTVNVFLLYLLVQTIEDFIVRGRWELWAQTKEYAELLYRISDASSKTRPFIQLHTARSITTVVLVVEEGSLWLIKKLELRKLLVGTGYGDYKKGQIRILISPATFEKIPYLAALLKQYC